MSNILLDVLISSDGYKFVGALKDGFTAIGILVGGWWTYTRFIQGREKETALAIDLTYTTDSYSNGNWLAFVNILLKNQGKVAVRACKSTNPAYDKRDEDGLQHFYKYGGSLKICEIPNQLTANTHIDWFSELPLPGWSDRTLEFNVLSGYVNQESNLAGGTVQTDFWMEPGESYSLAVPLILKEGLYIALVTFIGTKDFEYWQRKFLLHVPCKIASSRSEDLNDG